MNILFVCKWNQGRSQIAEALYKKYFPKNSAVSVGTHTTKHNSSVPLSKCAPLVVRVLNQWDIDVNNKYPKRLTQEYAKNADVIVVLCDMSNLPLYLLGNPKVTHWPIDDPDGKGYEYHVVMRDKIDKLIKDTFKAR